MAELTDLEKKELLELARETIRGRFAPGEAPSPARGRPGLRRKARRLRHPAPRRRTARLHRLPAAAQAALGSRGGDGRCRRLRRPALSRPSPPTSWARLDIEISVLTVPQKVDGPDEVQVGRDGIIVSKGFQRGLLLPQVPVEQGWDLEQYISYGCRKAGLAADEWKRGVQIETFQAIVFGEKKHGEEA